MKGLWAIACRSASVDQITNVASLFELVEELQINASGAALESLPEGTLIERELTIVALLSRSKDEPEHDEVSVHMIAPKKEAPMAKIVVDLTQHKRFRLVARLPGIPFFGLGTYWFVLSDSQGRELVRCPIDLMLMPTG